MAFLSFTYIHKRYHIEKLTNSHTFEWIDFEIFFKKSYSHSERFVHLTNKHFANNNRFNKEKYTHKKRKSLHKTSRYQGITSLFLWLNVWLYFLFNFRQQKTTETPEFPRNETFLTISMFTAKLSRVFLKAINFFY